MMLKNKYLYRLILAMAGVLLGFSSCKDDPFKDSVFRLYDEVPAATWLQSHPEYSDWVKILERIKRLASFDISTTQNTLFVVNNASLQEYAESLDEADVNSIFDLSDERLITLVQYNTLPDYVITSKNMVGKIGKPTATGDFLTAVFDIQTSERYINNGLEEPSYIIEPDIEVLNGIIHVLDKPLRPLYETIWDVLNSNPEYSIFRDAIADTDSLQKYLDRQNATVYWGPEGSKRYYDYKDKKTVFVVPNYEYAQYSIQSYEQFKEEFFPDDDPTDPQSNFFEYMLYHIMPKMMSYEDLTTFPRVPRNETQFTESMILRTMSTLKCLSVLDNADGVIQFDAHLPNTHTSFTINYNKKDIPANNGYLHEIQGSIMEIPPTMAKYVMEIEFSDYIEFSAIEFYQSERIKGSSPEEWYFYPGDIPTIRWSAPSGAKVWYSSQYNAAGEGSGSPDSGLPTGTNRYKNYDAIYWDLGSSGTIYLTLPITPIGNYRMYVAKSSDPYVGGRYAVKWGLTDMGTDRNFKGGSETAEWGTMSASSEEVRDLSLRIAQAPGAAGIDRIVLMPE